MRAENEWGSIDLFFLRGWSKLESFGKNMKSLRLKLSFRLRLK